MLEESKPVSTSVTGHELSVEQPEAKLLDSHDKQTYQASVGSPPPITEHQIRHRVSYYAADEGNEQVQQNTRGQGQAPAEMPQGKA